MRLLLCKRCAFDVGHLVRPEGQLLPGASVGGGRSSGGSATGGAPGVGAAGATGRGTAGEGGTSKAAGGRAADGIGRGAPPPRAPPPPRARAAASSAAVACIHSPAKCVSAVYAAAVCAAVRLSGVWAIPDPAAA